GRLFIPGELKIFHGGTPVLAPPRGGATTQNGLVKNKKFTNRIQSCGLGVHIRYKKQLTKYLSPPDIFYAFFFFPQNKKK
ncbi:hypothetical protein ACVGWX_00020, partial [Enterobacter hormaechei]